MRKVTIGEATLYCGDCAEILPTLEGIDVCITDPPYVITGKGCGMAGDRKYLKDITESDLEGGFDTGILAPFERFVVFCAKAQLIELLSYTETRGLSWSLCTWNKPNPTPLVNNNYLPDTEYIIHAFNKGGVYGDYRHKSRFIIHPSGKSEYDHPTVKPLPVMQKFIETSSCRGQTILDPYMGSGTTGVACAAMGRRFIGCEISEKYFDIACRRIEAAYSQPDLFVTMPPKLPTQQPEGFL